MNKREDCPFCNVAARILENDLAFVVHDTHPVNPGHALMIPKRHVASYFETTPEEREAMLSLLFAMREKSDRELTADGYNIGVNVGDAAGQTVAHVHRHLIPRFRGDVENPRGGVHGVIPARQSY